MRHELTLETKIKSLEIKKNSVKRSKNLSNLQIWIKAQLTVETKIKSLEIKKNSVKPSKNLSNLQIWIKVPENSKTR